MITSGLHDLVVKEDVSLQRVKSFNQDFFLSLLRFVQEKDFDDFILHDRYARVLLKDLLVTFE